MMHGGRLLRFLTFAFLVITPASALAQQNDPVGPFVVDVKAVFARHKQEPSVANDLGVNPTNLPTHSLGFTVGGHWYPLHVGVMSFGFGGHLLRSRGSQTLEATSTTTGSSGTPTTTPTATPTVLRHFTAVVPEVSFNFGHRNGWSYISGGLGRSKLFVEREDQPVTDPPSRSTIHYGAGARWFTNHHMAVSLDFRWYSVAEAPASPTGGVAQPHTTLLVLSGGIGLR
jgi:hypothetical protein